MSTEPLALAYVDDHGRVRAINTASGWGDDDLVTGEAALKRLAVTLEHTRVRITQIPGAAFDDPRVRAAHILAIAIGNLLGPHPHPGHTRTALRRAMTILEGT